MDFDAFVAAVIAGATVFLAIIFWPSIATGVQDGLVMGSLYLLGAGGVVGTSLLMRKRHRVAAAVKAESRKRSLR